MRQGPLSAFSWRILSLATWAAITEYHNLGSLDRRHLLFIVLEAGKSKYKAPADRCVVRPASWLMGGHLLAMFSHGGRGRVLSGALLFKKGH